METENIIYENDNLEVTAEAETKKNDISVIKGLLYLIPTVLSAVVVSVYYLTIHFSRMLIVDILCEIFPGQNEYYGIIMLCIELLAYIIIPVIYVLWTLIASRFVNFIGGKKIFILSGIVGLIPGNTLFGIFPAILFSVINMISDYSLTFIKTELIGCLLTPLGIFAFSMIIYAIVCRAKAKKISEK